MKVCHVCKAECDDAAELCPVCGADLTAKIAAEEEKEEKIINTPVLLATLDDVVSAEILKDLLTEAGILYSSDSDADGTMKVTFGGSFVAEDIYVDEQDLDAANTIYEEFLNSGRGERKRMSFFKWGRKKEEEPDENEPVLAAVIKNPVTSEIFQDILKENGIPFICRQDGAGGSVKLLLGAGVVPDNIYVAAKNYETARGLYEAYLQTEVEPEEEITE